MAIATLDAPADYAPAHNGYGALPPAPGAPGAGRGLLVEMRVDWIEVDPDDPAARVAEDDDLRAMAATMTERAARGLPPVRLPVIGYKVGDQRFRLSDGARRTAAARLAGLATVPFVLVPPPASDRERLADLTLANEHRRALTPLQDAARVAAMLALGLTQGEVGAVLGWSQSKVSRTRALLDEPEPIRALLADGRLTPKHIEALGEVDEPELEWNGNEGRSAAEMRLHYAQMAAEQQFSVDYLRQRIGYYKQSNKNGREQAEQRATGRAIGAVMQGTATPEQQAEAAQRQADYEAKERQRTATQQREWDRLAARAQRDRATIAAVLGQESGAPPTLASWQLLAMRLLEVARGHLDNAHTHHVAIEQARSAEDIFRILGTLAPYIPVIGDDNRSLLSAYSGLENWADKRWGLNRRIADDLLAAKLIPPATHKKLLAQAAPLPATVPPTTTNVAVAPTEEDDADPAIAYEEASIEALTELPAACPDCDVELEWNDALDTEGPVLECPECGTVYAHADAAGRVTRVEFADDTYDYALDIDFPAADLEEDEDEADDADA